MKTKKSNYTALCKRPIEVIGSGEAAAAGLMIGVPLAGLGLSIYFAAKQRWLAAALTFFVGAPAATAIAAVIGTAVIKPDDKSKTLSSGGKTMALGRAR